MDLEPQRDGRWHFALGPVEKWIVAVAAAAFLGGGALFVNQVIGRLDEQNDKLGTLTTQQAVTNQQLQTLSNQLADVPQLSRQVAELKVRVDRHDEDLKELRAVRGLR